LDNDSEVEKLKSVSCNNCNEANVKNAKWCVKCSVVLVTKKHLKNKDEKINLIEKQLETQVIKSFVSVIGNIKDQR
jgi:hypothetical protein